LDAGISLRNETKIPFRGGSSPLQFSGLNCHFKVLSGRRAFHICQN
jgi:hypothetical protein